MYEVLLSSHAERDLKRLSAELFGRVVAKMKALSQDPLPPGCKKLVGSKHDYRIRVGDYRVIYELDAGAKEVRVTRVRHRREAYR